GRLNALDGKYTIVGQVIKGMDVAQKIAQVKTDKNDRPIENVTMKKVYMKEAETAETADTLEAEDTTTVADTTETEEPEVTKNPSGGGCGCGRSKTK
ncbi:MAG: peptidylprolyl isomerase, partial [candidate division WOR-3 bacterium]